MSDRVEQSGAAASRTLSDEYIAEIAAGRAHEKLRRDENKWRAILGVAIAFLAIFGYTKLSDIEATVSNNVYWQIYPALDGSIKAIKSDNELRIENLSEELRNEIELAVDDRVSSEISNINTAITLANFGLLVTKISLQPESFSNSDRDSAMALLRTLSSDDKIANSSEFLTHLSSFIESLNAAWYGNDMVLDELASIIVTKNIAVTDDIVELIMYHLVKSTPLRSRVDQDYIAIVDNFLRRADAINLMELSELVRLCRDFMDREAADEVGKELIRRISNLNASEKQAFSRNTLVLMEAVASGDLSNQKYIIVAWFYVRLDRAYEGKVFDALGLQDDEWASKIEELATTLN